MWHVRKFSSESRFALLHYLNETYFALESLYFDSHSCELLSIPLKHHRENNSPHLQAGTLSSSKRDDIWHYNIALSFPLAHRESAPRSNQSRFSSRSPSSPLLFRFHRRDGNWREPRRSTRREPLWRTVNPFRLFLFRPQAWERRERGEGPRWKKNQFSSSFIGTDSCRHADCNGKSGIRNWSRTASARRIFRKYIYALLSERIARGSGEPYFSNRWIN